MEEIDKTVDVEIINDDNQREKMIELETYVNDIQSELPMIQEMVDENDYINLLKDSITQIPQVIQKQEEQQEQQNVIIEKMNGFFDSFDKELKEQSEYRKRQDEANKNLINYIQNLESKALTNETVSETVSTIIQNELSKNNNNEQLLKEIKSSKTMNIVAIAMSSITLISVLGALSYLFLVK